MGKRKPIILAIALLLVLGAGYYELRQNFFGTADGTVQPVVAKPTPESTVGQRIAIHGKYVDFSYPAKFTKSGVEAINPPVLERYNFTKTQGAAWQIAIQVSQLDAGSLSDDGSYHYRDITPMTFDRQEKTIGGNQTVIFSDKTSAVFNKVAYLHKGSLDASIAMSGGLVTNVDQLQTDLEAIIASWQWH